MAQVQSLAQELSHATGAAQKKERRFKLFFTFFFFLGPHVQHMKVPRLVVGIGAAAAPMLQPQQQGIQAESVTYTTAHGNARFLTY